MRVDSPAVDVSDADRIARLESQVDVLAAAVLAMSCEVFPHPRAEWTAALSVSEQMGFLVPYGTTFEDVLRAALARADLWRTTL